MARTFSEENEEDGYRFFYSIFDDEFTEAFGGTDPSADTDIARACSQAMGEFAQGEVRVFNHAGAKDDSFWKTIELPALRANEKVTAIWMMEDNTTDPDTYDGEDNLKDGDFEPSDDDDDDDEMDVDDGDDGDEEDGEGEDDDSFIDNIIDTLNPFDKRAVN